MISFVFFIYFYFSVYIATAIFNSVPNLKIVSVQMVPDSMLHGYRFTIKNRNVDTLYNVLNNVPNIENVKLTKGRRHTTCYVETGNDVTCDLCEIAMEQMEFQDVKVYMNDNLIQI